MCCVTRVRSGFGVGKGRHKACPYGGLWPGTARTARGEQTMLARQASVKNKHGGEPGRGVELQWLVGPYAR